MQPKTEFQKKIVGLSGKLSPISFKQIQWASKECTQDLAVVSRKTTYCLECGHYWKSDTPTNITQDNINCPSCGKKLKYCDKGTKKESTYFVIITTKAGLQVVRVFVITKHYKKKCESTFSILEVMQHWIGPDGKKESLIHPTNNMCYEIDHWSWEGDLEIRSKSERRDALCSIVPWKFYPGRSILSTIKRNGFKGYFHSFAPQDLFSLLLKYNKAEILFKSGQLKLLKSFEYKAEWVSEYWDSIMICIRHNYIVKDSSLYLDYLSLLSYFGKDLRSPKYLFPESLEKEHDKLSKKKKAIIQKQKSRQWETKYLEEKGRYFGIHFTDNDKLITVSPLTSVKEFITESDTLHHCVFSNEYFKDTVSLILSAKVNNERTETIEVNLKHLKIMQSRGLQNQPTKYHNDIIHLVQKNMHRIGKIAAKDKLLKGA